MHHLKMAGYYAIAHRTIKTFAKVYCYWFKYFCITVLSLQIITRSPGKMLGGSTSHHGLVYNRGSPYDFDAWAQATNDSSWKYENVLEYFKRSENLVGVGDEGTSKFIG